MNLTGNALDPRLLSEIFLANQSRIGERINADPYALLTEHTTHRHHQKDKRSVIVCYLS